MEGMLRRRPADPLDADDSGGSPRDRQASPRPGHGLAGLEERVQGLRGLFVVDSPVGGPTVIGAHIPFAPVAPSPIE